MMTVAGRRLRVADWKGPDWHDTPDAPPPLVLFTGLGMNLEMIEPVVRALPERRVISFDAPGIGKSPDAFLPYTIPGLALTTGLLLDRLGVDKIDLAGFSWGGALAQQFAFQNQARVRKLVLAATSAGAAMLPGSPTIMTELMDPFQFTSARPLRKTLAMLYGGGAHDPVSLNAALPPTPWGWTCQLGAYAAWTSLPFLPLLDLPTLVMTDDDDQIVPPANGEMLHTLLPNSRLVRFGGGGHLFMLTRRSEFVVALTEFLDS
ncbi:alpha/beta hydrolase [Novosphingobium sp.]|uniref:alpha/beta fold hydrolase n=1 Tax=Novosphingobium sp. TaxID=1874826 RepID=UPI0025F93C21|nr:alpha/beta hydrolase [Novosphingobium sp.]